MILNNPPLCGAVTYDHRSGSYIMKIWIISNSEPIVSKSYGNGVTAEDNLLNLLENPTWTILKYT